MVKIATDYEGRLPKSVRGKGKMYAHPNTKLFLDKPPSDRNTLPTGKVYEMSALEKLTCIPLSPTEKKIFEGIMTATAASNTLTEYDLLNDILTAYDVKGTKAEGFCLALKPTLDPNASGKDRAHFLRAGAALQRLGFTGEFGAPTNNEDKGNTGGKGKEKNKGKDRNKNKDDKQENIYMPARTATNLDLMDKLKIQSVAKTSALTNHIINANSK